MITALGLHPRTKVAMPPSPASPELRRSAVGHGEEGVGKAFSCGKGTWRSNGFTAPNRDHSFFSSQRIAEGNPDPDRIGAFGVGFYSLFSICEEPIVSSGDELMGFFWRGDALYTRRARTAAADLSPAGKPWTTFFMPLREQTPFPETPMALARFLATSLTFTTRVRKISLWFDDHLLCALDKKLSPPKSLTMPGHLNTTSAGKMMKVTALDSTALQMDCQVMRLVLAAAEKERPKPKPTALASAFTKSAGVSLTSMLQSAFGRSSNKEKDARPAPPPTPAPVEDPATTNAKMLDTVTATVHLRIATANVAVAADAAFQREIERSTKKPPPTNTAFHVIFTNKDEYDASVGEHEESGEAGARNGNTDGGVRQIFQGLLPRLDEQGHTFIGFRTHQTTGFSGHIAARFIPTVERESLDFIDRYCAKWNNELLSMGGYVARAVYEAELAEVGKLWAEMIGTGRPKDDDKGAQWLFDRALHTMRFFTFRTSSPSSRVFTVFEQSFFSCARQATITLMSTRGVKHSAAVRFPNAILADFVKDLAVLIPAHVEAAGEFVGAVRSRNLIKDVTMDDVFQELAGRALSPEEMVACLKWWISVAAHPSYDPSLRNRLLENAVISAPAPASEKEGDALPQRKEASIQALAFVRTFLNPQRVPTDVPLPESCLLYEVSKSLGAIDLNRVFDWTELSISDWLEHIVRLCNVNSSTALETNIQLSPAFAEKVFGIIARSWGSLPAHRHKEIAAILKDVPCIPTKKGMQKPGDAYFSHVSLFSDLPVVAFPTAQVKGNLEKVLVALSVRKHIELQMIFDRLVSAGDWSHVDLLGYLVTIRDSLAPLEIDRLKKTAIFPKAGEPSTVGPNGKPKLTRYRASQLYEPLDTLKALNLPLLDWSGGKPWRTTSDEAKFAFELGLQRHPPLDDLLSLASNTADAALRSGALAYFFDKYLTVYKSEYSITRASPFAFVPCQVGRSNTAQLRKPTEAFTNPEARVMDFAVVSSDLTAADVAKLQLRANPPSGQLISRLVNKPVKDEALARKIFEYLASVQEFTLHDYSVLKTAEFIPIKSKKGKGGHEEVQLVTPESAYFGSTSGSSTPQFK